MRVRDLRSVDRYVNGSDTAIWCVDQGGLAVEGSAREVWSRLRPRLVKKFVAWWVGVWLVVAGGTAAVVAPHSPSASVTCALSLLPLLYLAMRQLAFPVPLGFTAMPFGLKIRAHLPSVVAFPRADGKWVFDIPVLPALLFDDVSDPERQLLLRVRDEPDRVRAGVVKSLWEASARAHYDRQREVEATEVRRLMAERRANHHRVAEILQEPAGRG